MMGEENDPGVMVMAAQQIFNEIERKPNFQFLLRGGFIEIYNEKINDLLNKSNQELKIHDVANGNAQVNCTEVCITSENDLLRLLQQGSEARTVGGTNMNERSSRSHAIFRLIIESRQTDNPDDDMVTQSVLNLVDLAGSERADQTGASGARLKEGGHINKSLLFLSNVIKQLSENNDTKYISYRCSKLTRILQASLGGNAFTSIICTINPTSAEETLSTLNFATRAKSVKNKPEVNDVVSEATMLKRLTREIKDLKKQLDEERRQNVSQIKVAQIEKLLGFKELKLVTSSHSSRAKPENRRRTWCPQSTKSPEPKSSISVQSTNPFKNGNTTSRLKPSVYYTPHIGVRNPEPEIIWKVESNISPLKEEFEPAELIDFNNFVIPPETPINNNNLHLTPDRELSLSPSAKNTSQHVRMLEEEIEALQEFSNLEKKFDVQHDVNGNLSYKFEAMRKRNELLENERLKYLTTQNELFLLKEQLNNSEKSCNQLQVQIAKLTRDNIEEKSKVDEYKSELQQLKTTLHVLEVENRNLVSSQFEYEVHRDKSKVREKELLELLEEKKNEVLNLEKKLQSVKIQIKDQPQLTNGNSYITNGNNNDANQSTQCSKCQNLQKLMDENENVKFEFDQLTKQYQELQESYQKIATESTTLKSQLTELNFWQKEEASKSEDCKRELCEEISKLRQQFENLQCDYDVVKDGLIAKSEDCETLYQEIENAQQQLRMQQEKYAIIKDSCQKQEDFIVTIKADYEALVKRYGELKASYENQERNTPISSDDIESLKSENETLEKEVRNLKNRVQDTQYQLLCEETTSSHDESLLSNEHGAPLPSMQSYLETQKENERLKAEYKDLRTQNEELQHEIELLSTNVIETVEENDALIAKCKILEEAQASLESDRESLIQKINDLQKELDGVSPRTSSTTSGQPMSEEDEKIHESNKNENNPLGCSSKKRYTYTFGELKHIQYISESKSFRLSLGNWKGGNPELGDGKAMCDSMRKDDAANENLVEKLQKKVNDLEAQIKLLESEKDSILESCQNRLSELREQIHILRSALSEKSMVLEDVLKEKEEITMLNEELQVRLGLSQNEMDITTINNNVNETICQELDHTTQQLEDDAAAGDRSKCFDVTELKTLRQKVKSKEEECNRLKLDMLQRLEEAKDGFRSNLRKYNERWEEKSRWYELKIKQLLGNSYYGKPELKTEHDQSPISSSNTMKSDFVDVNDDLEIEENHTSHRGENMSSTPKTPSPSRNGSYANCFEMLHKSRLDCSQMLKECNEQIEQVSDSLAQKDKLLLEKEEVIENLLITLESSMDRGREVSQNSEEVNQLKETVQRLEQKIHHMEKVIELRDMNIKNLKIELEEEVTNLQTLQMQQRNEINRLNFELAEALKNVQEATEESKLLRLNKEGTEETLKLLQSEYDTILADRDELLGSVENADDQKKKVLTQMLEMQLSRTELQRKYDALMSEKMKLENQIMQAERERKKAEAHLNSLEAENPKLDENSPQKNVLLNDLEETKSELRKGQEEMKSLLHVLNEMKHRLHDVEETKSQLQKGQEEKKRLLHELEETKSLLRECQDELESMKDKHDTFKDADEGHRSLQTKPIDTNNLLQKEILNLKKNLELSQQRSIYLKEKLDTLKDADEELCSLKAYLTERNDLHQKEILNLTKNLEESKQAIVDLKDKLDTLKDADEERCTLKAKLIETNDLHQKEILNLTKSLEERKQASVDLKEKTEELSSKVDTLSQELHKSRQQTASLERTLQEYEGIEKQLDDVNREKVDLNHVIKTLQENLNNLKNCVEEFSESENDDLEILVHQLKAKYNGTIENERKLCQQVAELQEELQEEQKKSQRGNADMLSQLHELQLKNDALKNLNDELMIKNKDIEKRMIDLQNDVAEYSQLHRNIQQLENEQRHIKTSLSESEELVASLQTQIIEKETALEELRIILKTNETAYETAKLNMESSINDLKCENKTLCERLEALSEILKKRSEMCESANNSMETVSLQNSSWSRLSPCKTTNNAEDKLVSIKKERKNRRLSTHDENRRQSAKFSMSVDASTQTDSSMIYSELNELRQKLKESETQLFIRTSQVSALRLDLRNHPSIAEKATLIKHIQEEQQNKRIEIQKYRSKITEQSAKIQELSDQLKITEKIKNVPKVNSSTCTSPTKTANSSTCTSPKKDVISIETQTDKEIDFCLQKLQGKYNDLKKICRWRGNRILFLEKIVEEKENIVRGEYATLDNQQQQQQHPQVLQRATDDSKQNDAK